MATIAAIRTAIATVLDTIDGLNVHARMPDSLVSPAAVALLRSSSRVTMGSGTIKTDFEIAVYASVADLESGQITLDELLSVSGAKSIYSAFDADRTLGGVVSSLMLSGGWSGYSTVMAGGVEYVRAFFRLPVYHN